MRRTVPIVAALALVTGALSAPTAANAASEPRWVTHIQQYPGSISNGVRAMFAAQSAAPPATRERPPSGRAGLRRRRSAAVPNVQMNDDSNPPLPQNETAVAYNVAHPLIAVAAANDYVSGGVVVMRTTDGGRHWASTRITPQFRGTGDFCNGGDPGVAYSRRDGAFYLSQLCFFRALPFSEVHVFKSVDNGQTWTPGTASGQRRVQLRLHHRYRR